MIDSTELETMLENLKASLQQIASERAAAETRAAELHDMEQRQMGAIQLAEMLIEAPVPESGTGEEDKQGGEIEKE